MQKTSDQFSSQAMGTDDLIQQPKSSALSQRLNNLRKQFPFPLRFSIPIVLLVFGALLGVVNVQRETSRSFRRVEERVSSNAQFVGEQVSSILEYLYRRGDIEQSEIAISQMRSDANLTLSLFLDEKNRVLLATAYELRNQPIESTPAVQTMRLMQEVRETMAGRVILSKDRQHVWAIYPVPLGADRGTLRPSKVGVLWLEYDLSILKHQALVDALQRSIEVIAGLAVLCIAAWFLFDRTLTQRAARLVTASQNLTKGHLSQRASLKGSDELAQIAAAFNQMAARIQSDTEALKTSETALKQANETLESRVKERTAELQQQTALLEQTLHELRQTQAQLVQTEKMSSLGQLVAGVAHEINNPVSFIHGNISYAITYAQDLLALIGLYQQAYPAPTAEIEKKIDEIDLDFLVKDFEQTLTSMQVGTERIRQIVLSLRNFSRVDEAGFKPVEIHDGIDSTLLILQHRLKATPIHPPIEVVKEYGELPLVECYPGQINQVFMNILTNALDALEEVDTQRTTEEMEESPSQITIRTSLVDSRWAEIAIADNGPGIPEPIQCSIFDPFFTTKPVGKGTGMGMSISYQIITETHNGTLACFSTLGKGTEFVIRIPIQQSSG